MECEPPLSEEVAHVAMPVAGVTATALQPLIVLPLSVNPTEPERATAPLDGEMVAVKVTTWLTAEGLAEDERVVVVEAVLTVCATAEDVLVA